EIEDLYLPLELESVNWGKFARIKINMKIIEVLPSIIEIFLTSGKTVEVSLKYERLPKKVSFLWSSWTPYGSLS
ncbi:hypothetical protein MKW92_046839, partial [Papaver armeniacum]